LCNLQLLVIGITNVYEGPVCSTQILQ